MVKQINVEVVYALPDKQEVIALVVDEDCSIKQAIQQSNIEQIFPEINLSDMPVGIFAQLRNPDDKLKDGDRIEIYRPLIMDPKESRRQRAALAKQKKNRR
jgi:putative ubiquitin-RnfH superfamily antitoxin RatB of RatAB toxin-antitoxin module